MSTPIVRLNEAIAHFVDGGPFLDLWREVMDSTETVDAERDIQAEDREKYEDLYDLVYMGQQSSASADEEASGLVGEAALRERLKKFRPRASTSDTS